MILPLGFMLLLNYTWYYCSMAEKRDIDISKPNQLLRNLSDLHKEIYLLVTFYGIVIVIAFSICQRGANVTGSRKGIAHDT
jgi:hypothetical protein